MLTSTPRHSLRFVILAMSSVLLSQSAGAQTDQRGRLEGTVIDSVHARPLAGARIVALGADGRAEMRRAVVTDSTGRYHIDSLPPGRYLVGFESPLLDSLEITLTPREIAVAEGAVATTDLSLPPATKLRSAVCSGAKLPADKGVLYGHVVDAETEAPLAGAVVVALWRELTVDRTTLRSESNERIASDTTDEGGWYRLCGVPTGSWVSFQLQHLGLSGPVIRTLMDTTLGITIQHLSLDRSAPTVDSLARAMTGAAAASGTARLTGVIRGTGDLPLGAAEVRVLGTRAIVQTDASGRYSLGDLPAGTQLLEVRRIGYGLVDVPVELRSGATATGDLRLQRIVNLDSVRVVAIGSRYREFSDHRARSMFGVFLDPETMAAEHAVQMSDIIRKIPGFIIRGEGPYARVLSARAPTLAPCEANIIVNGIPRQPINDFPPMLVGAVEAYREGEITPNDYFDLRGCATIAIWTKR
jgi:hypothetical protein